MSFPKSPKVLYQDTKYNPPPGYYEPNVQKIKLNYQTHSFNRQQRFISKDLSITPGPGAFYNDTKQRVKKRIIQQSKALEKNYDNNNISNIKISSIPSIPKKSATRVYQELAPGILILHEQQYQNSNVGPGSYNIANNYLKKKTVCHKINPQHKKKFHQPSYQLAPPTINDITRQQRRLLYKKNLIKSSAIQRNIISPSDLCLEVIILREKLLRGDQVPPPGYYYDPNLFSCFKPKDQDKPIQLQLLAGKDERFKEVEEKEDVGPGSYQKQSQPFNIGGFIPKQQRPINYIKPDHRPGPGSYKIQPVQSVKLQPKGNYPPIFGSGCARFLSAPKTSNEVPGPGSYKLSKKKQKKTKYIKIRKDFIESKNDLSTKTADNTNIKNIFDEQQNKNQQITSRRKRQAKNTYCFSSKVQRFQKNQKGDDNCYYPFKSSVVKESFNRSQGDYVGSKQPRFDNTQIRPKIGPGTYDANYQVIRQKKINNIIL